MLRAMNSPTRLFTLVLALAAPFLAIGCGGDDAPPPAVDGGHDSGSVIDLGFDGAIDVDLGPVDVDLGPMDVDAGTETDGGPLLPPFDAGDPFGDAGTLGTPAWVPLDVLIDGSTCPPLVACGGDELGSWDVTGGCVDFMIPAALMACPGATVMASGQARGRVTFAGGFATRTAQSEVNAEVFIPALCAGFAGGCPAIQAQIEMAVPGAVCAATAAGDCNCAARTVTVIDGADAYTSMGNQIVATTGGKRWDYCITGMEMRYRDVSTSGSIEPGIIELGRR